MSDSSLTRNFSPSIAWGEYNKVAFAIDQALAHVQTALPVKIVACTNSGGVSPVGYVDAIPLVHQTDASGNTVPHSTIFNLPYCRIQGGANAVIIDPQIGDIGVAVFASRDISKVKNAKKASPPGSMRKYSFSDGMYIAGAMNGTPTQYIQFTSGGIVIVSPNSVTINAPTATINATSAINATTPTMTVNGNLVVNGNSTMNGGISQTGSSNTASFAGSMTVSGDVTANGTSVHTHKHGGVTTGAGQTGVPV